MKWGIIGLGWLGSELAARLSSAHIEYWGTTRKIFDWEKDDFPSINSDVLFLNTPPLTNLSPHEFVSKITTKARKIIFISSIGVYGNISGGITEKSSPAPCTTSGIWLYQVEKLLISQFRERLTIIRAGGLIGGQRHPVISLAKKTEREVSDGMINLIHRKDLIEIIIAISAMEGPLIVNAVAPYHPLKSSYYQRWCQKLSLSPLKFSKELEGSKIIESDVLDHFYFQWHCPELDNL